MRYELLKKTDFTEEQQVVAPDELMGQAPDINQIAGGNDLDQIPGAGAV